MEGNAAESLLLSDIRVLDLADEKGSFCAKVLADLGARVTRMEGSAEDSLKSAERLASNGLHSESLFYGYNNTDKKKISVDLARQGDRELVLGKIKHFDIVVESFAPGYLDELGLGFHSLIRENPSTIMVSVSGFGQDGPRKRYKSCNLVAAALGGQMYVTGSPSGCPMKAPGTQSYNTAGLYGVIGALLGLRRRAKTGKGMHVDISLQEAVASTLDHVLVQYFHGGAIAKRRGSRHWNDFFCILPCTDGFIHLTPLMGWEILVELLENEGAAEDLKAPQWSDEAYRISNLAHILEVLGRWTRIHSVHALFELGQTLRFPWAPVCSPLEVIESPQLRERRFFRNADFPETGQPAPCPGVPFKFSPFPFTEPMGNTVTTHEPVYLHSGIGDGNEKPVSGKDGLRSGPQGRDFNGRSLLGGIRVLDFSRVLAGPYATRILGDFGAEVIKVQSGKTATGAEDNRGAYFTAWNRNKRSMCLDMSHPEAREIALKLVSMSDVVVENFSPRVMSNWRMNYEQLREIKEDLIMLSMSGMGQTGPWRDFVAYGPTVQSLGGLTYLASHDKWAPLGLGYSYADAVSGIYGAIAVLAALEARARTGQGGHIDLSEYEAVCTLIGPALFEASLKPKQAHPLGNRPSHAEAAPYGCYRCLGEDRWCVIAVYDQRGWEALCQVSGHPRWAEDRRFLTRAMRWRHADELDRLIEAWTSMTRAEAVMECLQSAGVAAGVVQDAGDLVKDPQLQAREFFTELVHPLMGKTVTDRSPVRIEGVFPGNWTPAPLLGSDNRYVYLELLGFTETKFQDYVQKGVIG